MTDGARIRRLLAVGGLIADIRVEVPRLPPRGGDVLGKPATVGAGGVFNVLAAAARNGLAAAFAGLHGTGPFGDRIRADLAAEGVPLLTRPCPHGDSGFCLVMVEPDGERTFVTSPGVEQGPEPDRPDAVAVGRADALFLSGYDLCYPAVGPALARRVGALSTGAVLVFDPGPLADQIPQQILRPVLARTDLLTLNRREARLLAATEKIGPLAEAILPRLAPGALLVLRDGPRGCHLAGGPVGIRPAHVTAPAVQMVDATGAGDTHTGVLLAGIAGGRDPVAAAIRANAAAAVSVTRRGPATAPTMAELDAFLAETARAAALPPGASEPATTSTGGSTP
ncbi:MAG: PfkB family carbohydrate kinase [Alphaproteobacteria bacterium]